MVTPSEYDFHSTMFDSYSTSIVPYLIDAYESIKSCSTFVYVNSLNTFLHFLISFSSISTTIFNMCLPNEMCPITYYLFIQFTACLINCYYYALLMFENFHLFKHFLTSICRNNAERASQNALLKHFYRWSDLLTFARLQIQIFVFFLLLLLLSLDEMVESGIYGKIPANLRLKSSRCRLHLKRKSTTTTKILFSVTTVFRLSSLSLQNKIFKNFARKKNCVRCCRHR